MISLVVPTLGNLALLNELWNSLQKQIDPPPYEVLLCATGAGPEIIAQLPTLPAPVRFISSVASCISAARNLGLEQARGDLIFFVDDDCQIEKPDLLRNLYLDFTLNRQLCGGGFYDSRPTISYTSRLYNFMCNLWLETNARSSGQVQVLLGGCSFYPKNVLMEHHIRFSALRLKAGEEYSLNSHIVKLGIPLVLDKRWSITHSPGCNLSSLLKKAWVQGRSLQQKNTVSVFSFSNLVKAFVAQPMTFISYAPVLALYLGVGRLSYALELLKKPQRQPATVRQMHAHQVNEHYPAIAPTIKQRI